jgi:hypothetical protein
MNAVIPDIPTGEVTSEGKPILKFVTFDDIKEDFLRAFNSNAPSPIVDISDEGISKIDSRLNNFNPQVSSKQFNSVQALEGMVDNFLDKIDSTNGVSYSEHSVNPEVARMFPQAMFTPSTEIVMNEVRNDMRQSRIDHRAQLDTAKHLHEMAWGKDGGYNFLGW